MQIITHDDMDGYASAAVVYHAFLNAGIISKNSCSINHYNYSDKIPTINQDAEIVFITDYSISNETFMNDLLNTFNAGKIRLFWCDHHATSIDNCKGKYEVLKKIDGIRDTEYCGAALAWFFFSDLSLIPLTGFFIIKSSSRARCNISLRIIFILFCLSY